MKRIIERDLATAEAIISAGTKGRKKSHGPTLDNFKGQSIAYQRALALLEMQEATPPGPIEIHRNITITIPWSVLTVLAAGGILLFL